MNLPLAMLRRLGDAFDGTFLYDDGRGIKATRFLVQTPLFDRFDLRLPVEDVQLAPLLFAFDGLRDPWSLVDQPLTESPHVDLMRRLEAGQPIEDSGYVERLRTGTLDIRAARDVGPPELARIRTRFGERLAQVEAGTQPPLKVFRAGGQAYVADGKHTAALMMGRHASAPAVDISPFLFDSFYWWVRDRMARQPAAFGRNLRFFERLLRDGGSV